MTILVTGATGQIGRHDVEQLIHRGADVRALVRHPAKANLPAEIEVYEGTLHGLCPPDSQVYNEAQAEKAWSRLLALFGKALA